MNLRNGAAQSVYVNSIVPVHQVILTAGILNHIVYHFQVSSLTEMEKFLDCEISEETNSSKSSSKKIKPYIYNKV
jgi:hypothetical protein